MTKKQDKKLGKDKLDLKEQDWLETFERGEWKSIASIEGEAKKAEQAAKKYLKKRPAN